MTYHIKRGQLGQDIETGMLMFSRFLKNTFCKLYIDTYIFEIQFYIPKICLRYLNHDTMVFLYEG